MPAEIRRRLGVATGSVLACDEIGGKIVVRRAGRFSSEEVHRMLFPQTPPRAGTLAEMEAGIRNHMHKRHARGFVLHR